MLCRKRRIGQRREKSEQNIRLRSRINRRTNQQQPARRHHRPVPNSLHPRRRRDQRDGTTTRASSPRHPPEPDPQEGDTLVIYAIDRIGRNARDTLELVEELEKRKITLVSIREGVDLSSAVGQAVLGVMASFAQMERKLILERQAAGIEAAKSRGQKFGRPTKIGAKEAGEIVMRRAMGVPIATIAKQLNLSRSAIYRHLEKVDAVAPE